jgi:broad specificity phosphatase PhoE
MIENRTPPAVYIARHAETAWSLTGQHTGLTDLPLTEHGECDARRLGERLKGITFEKVYTSPLRRAVATCELAGFGPVSEIDADLVEWNYGKYEGLLTREILAHRPGWSLFRDGCPDGESPDQVAVRAHRILRRIHQASGNVLLFSSGHFLRLLATHWLGIETLYAKYFALSTSSVSVLGFEGFRKEPAILLWNDTHHLRTADFSS